MKSKNLKGQNDSYVNGNRLQKKIDETQNSENLPNDFVKGELRNFYNSIQ